MKIITKSGKNAVVRVVKGLNTCHAVVVARNGRVLAESDVMRPRFAVGDAERDGIALASRV